MVVYLFITSRTLSSYSLKPHLTLGLPMSMVIHNNVQNESKRKRKTHEAVNLGARLDSLVVRVISSNMMIKKER